MSAEPDLEARSGSTDPDSRLPPPDLDVLGEAAQQLVSMIARADRDGAFDFQTTDEDGHLIGLFRVLAYAPVLGESIARIGLAIDGSSALPERSRHAAILAVAADERSDYEWYSHELAARDSLTAEEINSLRRGVTPTFADDTEQVCGQVVRSLLERGDLADDLHGRAVALLGHSGLVELVWIVGLYQASALQLRVHRLGAPD